jgi:RNA polymerase sigma factor (TIGR02999 family)
MDDFSNNSEEIDRLLDAIRNGDHSAMDRLVPIVIGELSRLAHSILRFAPRDQTLRTKALVNEAYMRMVSKPPKDWKNRAYFFGVAAQTMRNVLVDYYRERNALKRGRDLVVQGVEIDGIVKPKDRWLNDLHEALYGLERVNETWAWIVKMHFFSGLTFEDIAKVLNTTRDSVRNQWRLAKAWLRREMQGDENR